MKVRKSWGLVALSAWAIVATNSVPGGRVGVAAPMERAKADPASMPNAAPDQDDCDKYADYRTVKVAIDNQTGKRIVSASVQLTSTLPLGKPYVKDTGVFSVCADVAAGSPCSVDPCRAGATPMVILATKGSGQVVLQNPDDSLDKRALPEVKPTPPATTLPEVNWTIH